MTKSPASSKSRSIDASPLRRSSTDVWAQAFALASIAAYLTARGLAGRKVVVVEDQFLIAEEIAVLLQAAGTRVVRPCRNCSAAQALFESDEPDVAILDVHLEAGSSASLARGLTDMKIPFVVASGADQAVLPPELRMAPYIAKPDEGVTLLAAVGCAIHDPASLYQFEARLSTAF